MTNCTFKYPLNYMFKYPNILTCLLNCIYTVTDTKTNDCSWHVHSFKVIFLNQDAGTRICECHSCECHVFAIKPFVAYKL